MSKITNAVHPLVVQELKNLPEAYDDFSTEFRLLLATMRVHGFSIYRADEAIPVVGPDKSLWAEAGHPSVLIQPRSDAFTLREAVRVAVPGSQEHTEATNRLVRANLLEQQRLLGLLDEFYEDRSPYFYARLVTQTDSLDGTRLKPQGGDIRVILENEEWQQEWFEESNAELQAFAYFLNAQLYKMDEDEASEATDRDEA